MWNDMFGKQTRSQWEAQQRAAFNQQAALSQQSPLGQAAIGRWQSSSLAEVVQLKEEIKKLEAKLQEPESKKLERIREHNKKLLERVTYYEKLKED